MVDFIQNTLDGVFIGSSYALLAIGFTLIFGVMRRVNLSYGPSIMLGVFAGAFVYLEIEAGLVLVAGATLAGVLALLFAVERTRIGAILRMLGEDDLLAEAQGVNRTYYKVLATVAAGAIAGIGGVLYAHMNTYVEPKIFSVMLGVHGLAYGLVGGLGTAFGPLLGAALDVGVLESTRTFSGYRMIVFGGLVAVLLIFRPRGLLDEEAVHAVRSGLRRLFRRRGSAGGG